VSDDEEKGKKNYLNLIINEFTNEKFMEMQDLESFENFKSNICHLLKYLGDKIFLEAVIKKDLISYCFEKKLVIECFYLLGMIDYLCRINEIEKEKKYDYIREYGLEKPLFPEGVDFMCYIMKNEKYREDYLKKAIPEFLKYNIVEGDVRNVA